LLFLSLGLPPPFLGLRRKPAAVLSLGLKPLLFLSLGL
jgi:hypothetical protein